MANLPSATKVMWIRQMMAKSHVLVLWHPDTNFVLCNPADAYITSRYYSSTKQAEIQHLMHGDYKEFRKQKEVEPPLKYGVIFAEVSSSPVCVLL